MWKNGEFSWGFDKDGIWNEIELTRNWRSKVQPEKWFKNQVQPVIWNDSNDKWKVFLDVTALEFHSSLGGF